MRKINDRPFYYVTLQLGGASLLSYCNIFARQNLRLICSYPASYSASICVSMSLSFCLCAGMERLQTEMESGRLWRRRHAARPIRTHLAARHRTVQQVSITFMHLY